MATNLASRRQLDEREPGGLGGVHQRRGQLVVPAAELDDQPGRAGPCEVGDVTLQPGVVGRQQQTPVVSSSSPPRSSRAMSAQLGDVRPAHPHVQTRAPATTSAGRPHRRHRRTSRTVGGTPGRACSRSDTRRTLRPRRQTVSAWDGAGCQSAPGRPSRSSPGIGLCFGGRVSSGCNGTVAIRRPGALIRRNHCPNAARHARIGRYAAIARRPTAGGTDQDDGGSDGRVSTSPAVASSPGNPWTAPPGPTHDVLDPSTGELRRGAPAGRRADVDAAVAAAKAAFPDWSRVHARRAGGRTEPARGAHERASRGLRPGRDRPDRQADQADPGVRRTGHDRQHRRSSPARPATSRARRRASTRPATPRRSGARPIGVVGSIAPWNYPLQMAAWKILPAIAAGNTIVLKPAELTPLTSLMLAEAAVRGGHPGRGASTSSPATGRVAGEALVGAPRRRDGVLHRLDRRSAQRVMEIAARTAKRVHLELGGKAPFVVFDDADLRGRRQRRRRRLADQHRVRTAPPPPARTCSGRSTTRSSPVSPT